MITIKGKSVFGGISVGRISFYKRQDQKVRRIHIEDKNREVQRFYEAKNQAVEQLRG